MVRRLPQAACHGVTTQSQPNMGQWRPCGDTRAMECFLICQMEYCHMCDQAGDYWLGLRCEPRGQMSYHVRGGEVAKMAARASTVPRTVLHPVMSQSSTVLYCNAVSLGSSLKSFWLFKKIKDIFYQGYVPFLLSHYP